MYQTLLRVGVVLAVGTPILHAVRVVLYGRSARYKIDQRLADLRAAKPVSAREERVRARLAAYTKGG